MNPSPENQDATQFDDLPDRLIDLGLSELVGRKTPPDLSARILAAQPLHTRYTSMPAAINRELSSFKWFSLAIAAMLLVGLTTLLLPSVHRAGKQLFVIVRYPRDCKTITTLQVLSHSRNW